MPKVIGLDYGSKRTGVAISDDRGMIASPLATIETVKILEYLVSLIQKEKVQIMVLGEAKRLNGQASAITEEQEKFAQKLRQKFPDVAIYRVNEMFTSKMAQQSLIMGGYKKAQRAEKGNLDMMSAAIILQSYLDQQS
ncbi:MAG: Holliday junction resolvase RuvX [Flavobacteriales bacterium]|nr:Holliday junction resolvase RuvX [Flavobacteriales bacterium]